VEESVSVQPRSLVEVREASSPLTFEEFFEAQRDRLFRTLCLITGSRDEAEDLAQEAFVKVLERWDALQDLEDPSGYLHRTAMNAFRSRVRRAATAARRALGVVRPPDLYEHVDDRMVTMQAMGTLSPRQRAAVVLTDLLGYTAEEAGSLLGVRGSTVRALHFQARSALRAHLTPRGDDR
jgi:RNA polymerase sigma-70 factor, ECF subfamily